MLITVVLPAIAGLLAASAQAATLGSRQSVPSMMIVGDSISQGRTGDYTWRYRLWEWFNGEGVAVNFVGPYAGTAPQLPGQPRTPPPLAGASPASDPLSVLSSGGYAPDALPGFFGNELHFSVWGRQMAQDQGLIAGMVSSYTPDYLLVELGFNDVGWFISDAEGTLDSLRRLIANARSAKPNLKFILANIPM